MKLADEATKIALDIAAQNLRSIVRSKKKFEASIVAREAPLKAQMEELTGEDRKLLSEVKVMEAAMREEAEGLYLEAYRLVEATGGVVAMPEGVSASWLTFREITEADDVPAAFCSPDPSKWKGVEGEISGTEIVQKIQFRVASK